MPQDSHKGGSLTDMAVDGTSIPGDAGIQRTIPSVPRPDQKAENPAFNNEGIAAPSSAFAADNATDMPRGPRDMGPTGEVITGTGNTLPAGGEHKRNATNVHYPGAQGDVRDVKHTSQNRSDFERQGEPAEVAGVRNHEKKLT